MTNSKLMTYCRLNDYDELCLNYKYTPCENESEAPLLVLLHGHTHNALPSKYVNPNLNILVPIDNYGASNCGSWWLGESGDYFVKDVLHALIKEKARYSNGDLYLWGSSMGGYGALLHGMLLNAKAVYANIPQVKLLGSKYSDQGMHKFFKPIFGEDINSIYNDLTQVLEFISLKTSKSLPIFFIGQSRFDYDSYLEQQSLAFFKKCLDLNLNISYEVFPKKGHALMMPAHESIAKMLKLTKEAQDFKKNNVEDSNCQCVSSIITGMMNFSVLYKNTKAFKSSKKDYLEYKKDILDKNRLGLREKIFFEHTVPIMKKTKEIYAKKGINFFFNVAISDQLPVDLLARFKKLNDANADLFNVVKVSEDEPHSWLDIIQSKLTEIRGSNCKFRSSSVSLINFRLDDDDVLSLDYFKSLENYLKEEYAGFYLTFPQGYVGIYGDESFSEFYKINKPYLAIGLAKVCIYSSLENRILTDLPIVNAVSHTKIVNDSRTILDSSVVSYIWTMHKYSDTRSLDSNHESSLAKIYNYIKDNQLNEANKQEVESFFNLKGCITE